MQRVAVDGPHDPAVWRKLVARADVIAHSLTAKQAALALSAMARAQHREESFLRRFCVRFVPSLSATAEPLDLCGIVSSLSQLGTYCEETYGLLASRIIDVAPQLDARQLSLVANAFARVGHADRELFERLLAQVPRKILQFEARDVAVLLNALTSARGLHGKESGAATSAHLDAVALRLQDILPKADTHSLALIFNAFAQLRIEQKDALDLLVEELLSSRDRLARMAPRQVAMVLNAAAKLQLFEPKLLDALAVRVRSCARDLDPQSLCLVANACAKLRLGVDTFGALYEQVPRRLSQLSGRQLAMLCHAWAKGHVHNDDLFALLALPLAQKAGELASHEVAITIYGYAHFRKKPAGLFGPLLARSAVLLDEEAMSESDVLMLANALGRIGLRDEAVAKALQAYSAREPSLANLSPQAIAVFSLVEPAACPSDSATSAVSE